MYITGVPHRAAITKTDRKGEESMNTSKLIMELLAVLCEHGDIPVQLQSYPEPGDPIINYTAIFLVPELYHDEGESEMICNIRAWPY